MQLLRNYGLIIVGLVIVFVTALLVGLGTARPLLIFIGPIIIILGTALRAKAAKDRDNAR